MKYLALLLIVVAGCQTAVMPEPQNVKEQNRINKLVEATVKINVKCGEDGGSGSGVIISTNLLGNSKVLTAAHLDAKDTDDVNFCEFVVVNSKGVEFTATVISKDHTLDLMLLDVEGVAGPFTPVAPYSFVGQEITCVGFPVQMWDDQLHLSITKGEISVRFNAEDKIDAPIYFGSSGGPCYDNKDEVVGIVSFMLVGGVSSGYYVPVPGEYFVANSIGINRFLRELVM